MMARQGQDDDWVGRSSLPCPSIVSFHTKARHRQPGKGKAMTPWSVGKSSPPAADRSRLCLDLLEPGVVLTSCRIIFVAQEALLFLRQLAELMLSLHVGLTLPLRRRRRQKLLVSLGPVRNRSTFLLLSLLRVALFQRLDKIHRDLCPLTISSPPKRDMSPQLSTVFGLPYISFNESPSRSSSVDGTSSAPCQTIVGR